MPVTTAAAHTAGDKEPSDNDLRQTAGGARTQPTGDGGRRGGHTASGGDRRACRPTPPGGTGRCRTVPPADDWSLPPAFDAAIFDFDGTIADTASLWHEVDLAFLGARGLPFDDEYSRTLSVLGFRPGALYTKERFGLEESVEDICDEWNRMGRTLYRTRVTLREGAERYIRLLRRLGVPVALATTNDPEVLDAMRNVDVDALFDVRVHGREVDRAKDHPDIYLEAARRLGVAPTRCIVFEDIAEGIRSARQASMTTVAVRTDDPTQDFGELRAMADHAIDGWEGLAP